MATGGQVTGTDLSTDGHWDSGAKAIANDLLAVPISNTSNIIDSLSSMAGIDLDLLKIDSGRTGKFGSSTPIDVVADEMDLSGGGFIGINCGTGAFTTDILRVRMDNPGIEVVLGSSGTSNWKEMDLDRGRISFAGSTLFDAAAALRVGQVESQNDVTLTIAAAAATLARLDQSSGTSFLNNTVTLLNLKGGARCTKDNFPVTQAFIGPGCTLTYNHKVLTGQTTLIVVEPGGFLDLMGNTEPKQLDKVHVKKGGRIRVLIRPKMHIIDDYRNDNDQ